MQKIIFTAALFVLFFACKNPPSSPVKNDTAKHDTSTVRVDTFHVQSDSASTNHAVVHDCSVLKKKIPKDSSAPSISTDLGELVHCGLDSFDLLYIVPNLFPGYVGENHVKGNYAITYGDFLAHVKEFKLSPAYAELHERVLTLDSLRSIPFDKNNFAAMKPLVGRLGYTQDEWLSFVHFARTYPLPQKGTVTWGDMFEAFDNTMLQDPNDQH